MAQGIREADELLLEAMFDLGSDMIWAVEPARFALLAMNGRLLDSFSRHQPRPLALGMTPDDLFPEERARHWRSLYQRALEQGELAERYTSVDGRLTMDLRMRALTRDGVAKAIVVTARDVSAELAAREALERRESFYRKILQGSADLTAVFDPSGAYKFVSSAIHRVTGYTEDELMSSERFGRVHPDDRAAALSGFSQLANTAGGSSTSLHRLRHRDGRFITLDVRLTNLLEDPDVAGIVANARDVTQEVELRSQLLQAQKLESLGRLAGGIAHDFNNLLTVILGSTEGAKDALSRGAAADPADLEAVLAAGARARDLTRQLLAFASKQVYSPTAQDVAAVVSDTAKMLRRILGEDVRFALSASSALSAIRCDRAQIDQILLNLAVNARDAMPSGGAFSIDIDERVLSQDDPDWVGHPVRSGTRWVRVRVRDTGTGMSPEVLEHVFEPFFTTKGLGKGTGLGLATVYGIVDQMGGRIRVESEPGRGTMFEIILPALEGATVGEHEAAPPLDRRPTGETVLLVEDDVGARRVIARPLRRAGYHVIEVEDPRDALRLLVDSRDRVDLLLTDVVMPHVDGPTLVKGARTSRPDLRVLFVSGYTDERVAATERLLSKPFGSQELLRAVRSALDGVS